MTREPDWTPEEFELLLAFHHLSDTEVEAVIQTRSSGAVATVRQGVHAYHREARSDPGLLSRMMKRRLTAKPRSFPCHVCQEPI